MSDPGLTYNGWKSPERPAWSTDAFMAIDEEQQKPGGDTAAPKPIPNASTSYEDAPPTYELTESQTREFIRTGQLPLNTAAVDDGLRASLEDDGQLSLWERKDNAFASSGGNDGFSQAQSHNSRTAHSAADDTIQFPHITLGEGDVLVFVDVPKTKVDSRPATTCIGVAPCNQSFRVHSEKLLALRDSKFPAMLDNEIYQARVRRRRKLDPEQYPGIHYFLDMTPPVEGDDLVFQMMSLSLPQGIMDWWSADLFHGVDSQLVRGHDDLCSCFRDRHLADQKQAQRRLVNTKTLGMTEDERALYLESVGMTEDDLLPAKPPLTLPPSVTDLERLRARGATEVINTPSWFQIPDYCPFRHCNSIIRLFMIIEDKPVELKSAARVWTMVGISKIMDCPSVVSTHVAGWVLSNPRFIEVLPEEAFEIGFALQLPQVTLAAYRILVNELALEEAADDSRLTARSRLTIFGRRKREISDDEQSNLIEHAARAFIERVNSNLAWLQSPSLFDHLDIPQWAHLHKMKRLLELEDDGTFDAAKKALCKLMDALAHKASHAVEILVRCGAYGREANAQWDEDRAAVLTPQAFRPIQEIMLTLNTTQRLLLPSFYHDLERRLKTMYPGMDSLHPDSRHQHFLLGDVVRELNKLVQAQPDRRHREEWNSVFAPGLNNLRLAVPLLDMERFGDEVEYALKPIVRSWKRGDLGDKDAMPQLNITRHLLLALTHNELKFLPLWAGGNNDGTGGVFGSYVPPTDMGPNGPGPAFHTGCTIPSGPPSLSESLLDEITAFNIKGSTTAGSVDVHDSISTVYRPEKVIVADSSIASESTSGMESEYDRARFEIPAEHQNMGQAVELMVDSMDCSDDTATIGADSDSDHSLDDFEEARMHK
ncbi:uncharacterized protein F5Z01DRAFT_32678 [Emericellopsis atlantica]|uniref:Uncharacterized protein n=1 Tax=Emericellopsis atlantica TaxID=2614577 RepID=A0A9P8CTJ7_9HYPO|nr:uncharacterized protein F5Z01DRAFT_32678 [Emericellopsis atlantica]KAG9259244.1 hypothetical protein F5Z01DRAFT_32678 [Emericellopsis atlantica]